MAAGCRTAQHSRLSLPHTHTCLPACLLAWLVAVCLAASHINARARTHTHHRWHPRLNQLAGP